MGRIFSLRYLRLFVDPLDKLVPGDDDPVPNSDVGKACGANQFIGSGSGDSQYFFYLRHRKHEGQLVIISICIQYISSCGFVLWARFKAKPPSKNVTVHSITSKKNRGAVHRSTVIVTVLNRIFFKMLSKIFESFINNLREKDLQF